MNRNICIPVNETKLLFGKDQRILIYCMIFSIAAHMEWWLAFLAPLPFWNQRSWLPHNWVRNDSKNLGQGMNVQPPPVVSLTDKLQKSNFERR